MSVIVMGMEMPDNCYDCPFVRASWGDDFYCAKGNGTEDDIKKVYSKRMDDCPLIEVHTPHGRLIDADKFKADHSMKNDCAECEKELQGSSRSCEYDRIYSKMDFCEWIDNAETVIEAED